MLRNDGYEPITDDFYGFFSGDNTFPRAIGTSQADEASCFFRVNGNFIAFNSVNESLVESIVIDPDMDEQTFEGIARDNNIENILYVDTSLEALNNLYQGKTLNDY